MCLSSDKQFQEIVDAEQKSNGVIETIFFEEEFSKNQEETKICYKSSEKSEDETLQVETSETIPVQPEFVFKKPKNKSRYRPICGFCGKTQESEYRLRQHELIAHTSLSQLQPEEQFHCDICSRPFKTKQSIRNHFTVAHTSRNEVFPCSICGKVLPHQKALYAHERVHVKSEATCQYCSKTFERKVLLSSHIAVVHLKKRL